MTSSEFEVKKIKWLETAKTKKGIIAQLDPDGLYSAFIISRLTGLDVVGVSDLYNNIYGIDENDKLSDYVFVDVEMFLPDVLSVGNHNNITSPKVYEEIKDRLVNCLNPNYQFGVTVKEYTGKYPFGTAHYLIELYSEELNLPEGFESSYHNPLTLGLDIETGGHVFQLVISNSQAMNDAAVFTNAPGRWDGTKKLYFGFNMYRVF